MFQRCPDLHHPRTALRANDCDHREHILDSEPLLPDPRTIHVLDGYW